MIIEHVLEHLTSVSGSLDHVPISPSTMISEMINALPDEDELTGCRPGLRQCCTFGQTCHNVARQLTFLDRTMNQPL